MNNNNDLSRHSSATAGDSVRSFERDVLPVAGDLYRRALAYTKNDAHADDLVQETLLKAYKAFDKLRLETHLRAWLLCIMRNTWINNYRADLRRPVETLVGDIADGQLDSVVPHGSGHVLSAEHQALRHMLDPELAAALLTLSEDMRETVYYVAVLGMKCREEAELMGVPAGTLLSRMHRIRTNLRRSLGMDARDPDRGHAA